MIARQIRSAIEDFIADRITLDNLEERVAVLSWDASEAVADQLSAAVAGAIAELDRGDIAPDAFRERLAELIGVAERGDWRVTDLMFDGDADAGVRADAGVLVLQ